MYTIPRTEANTLLTFPLPRPNSPEFSLGQPFEFSSLVIESLQNYGAARVCFFLAFGFWFLVFGFCVIFCFIFVLFLF